MDISHSTNTTKDHNQNMKKLVKYFIDQCKRRKEEKEHKNKNLIDMDIFLKRKWEK